MTPFKYTLITDGSSDAVLMPVLTWLLEQNGVRRPIHPEWADLRRFPKTRSLSDKIRIGVEFYPCDLLFIHRDAERESREKRVEEIRKALQDLSELSMLPPPVCVVPVRMQEAWLLFDVSALRQAAGNRNGKAPLDLPGITDIENIPDPKAVLHSLLRTASGLKGRRLKQFRVNQGARRIPEFIDDFSSLRELSAFQALESDLKEILLQHFRTE